MCRVDMPEEPTRNAEEEFEQDGEVEVRTPEECLCLVQRLITFLLVTATAIKCFVGRWQIIRARIEQLKSCVSAVGESPHWMENELIKDLLPGIAETLRQIRRLAGQCSEMSYAGKLLMQSDLDMAAAKMAIHVRELDVLIKSGVLRQSSAIVLSWPSPGASRDEIGFFVRDLFARLQIGGPDFKLKALENLVQLLKQEHDKDDSDGSRNAAVAVAAECDVGCLVGLLDSSYPEVRELAAVVVAVLARTKMCRHGLVTEGALGPLVRLVESGSSLCKERAAAAIEGLTANSDNAWALAAYGGVPVLIRACRGGTPETQSAAAGALRNVSAVEEIRRSMAEDGAVPTLVSLAAAGHEKALECIHTLTAHDEKIANLITDSGGIQSLVNLLSNPAATMRLQELVLKAIHGLSASSVAATALAASPVFLTHLSRLLRASSVSGQQLAALVVCNVSVNSESKKALGEAGCIPPLVKMLESKVGATQEVAAQALACLLVVHSNRREFVKDDKGIPRLVQLLDPRNGSVSKKFPLSAVLALCSSTTCRKKIAMAGAPQHLQKLADMEVPGAKKVLQQVAGNRLRNLFNRKWKQY